MAIPNNRIPRVFIDTGIEYNMIKEFALKMAKTDDRFVIIKPNKPIKSTLEAVGYPFKSKEHSLRIEQFNKGHMPNYIRKYIDGYDAKKDTYTTFKCPKILAYQFEIRGKYNYSNKCCYEMKKNVAKQWQKSFNKIITITGMRNEEGGNRKHLGCISNKGKHFHPLVKVTEEWEDWFLDKYQIRICELYYPPYNFKRTGCKGCPFNRELQKQLDVMKELLPIEYAQCEAIWKPVYEEYRRIGYRLKKETLK